MVKRRTERDKERKERNKNKKPGGLSNYAKKGGPYPYERLSGIDRPRPDPRNRRQRLY